MTRAPKPFRVQLRQTPGWHMPPNTVSVARPQAYGNPWQIGRTGPMGRSALDAVGAVGLFRAMLEDTELRRAVGYPDTLAPLKGKNLACWCKRGEPCHADVLLELANR